MLRASGEPLRVVVTRSWLSNSTTTDFTYYRNGRSHSTSSLKTQVEFALLGPASAPIAIEQTPIKTTPQASTVSPRVQNAVDAIMAKIHAKPLPIPADAPRFVRDNLPADISGHLYPGKLLLAKRSGDALTLADEYSAILPRHLLPLFAMGCGLIALGGLLFCVFGRKIRDTKTEHENTPAPLEKTTGFPSHRGELKIISVEHWTDYNEYEGHCIAQWQGREDCFHLMLVGDEWDALQAGATWQAQIEFECASPLEISVDGSSFTPELTQCNGVNYRICGQVLQCDGEYVWLDLPWPILVDLDSSRRPETPIRPGCWLRAKGALEARI